MHFTEFYSQFLEMTLLFFFHYLLQVKFYETGDISLNESSFIIAGNFCFVGDSVYNSAIISVMQASILKGVCYYC